MNGMILQRMYPSYISKSLKSYK